MFPERLRAPAHNFAYKLIQYEAQLLVDLYTRGFDVQGLENIPQIGPAILAFGFHSGIAEIAWPLIYFGEEIVFLSKFENLKIPVIGDLARLIGAIPIRRGEVDRNAISMGVEALKRKKMLFMAPEGTRGRESKGNRRQLKPAKKGLVYIAKEAANDRGINIPILPIAIWGGNEWFWPEIDIGKLHLRQAIWHLGYRKEPIFVRIAEPILIEPDNRGKIDLVSMKELSDQIMIIIRNMLPEKYHGCYPK